VRSLEEGPPVWGTSIHDTGNDTLSVSCTDSVSKCIFSARHTARDDAMDPWFVTDLDFIFPISSETFVQARY